MGIWAGVLHSWLLAWVLGSGGGEQGETQASAVCERENIWGEDRQNAIGEESAKAVPAVGLLGTDNIWASLWSSPRGSMAGSLVMKAMIIHNSPRSSAADAARGPRTGGPWEPG